MIAQFCFPEIWNWVSPFLPSCLSTGFQMKPNSRWLIWSKYNLLVSSDSLLCMPSPLHCWTDLGGVWRHSPSETHYYYIIVIWRSIVSLWIFNVASFLAFRQTSQLLVAHFDTTVSISADTSVKSKTMSEDSVRLETDGTISSFTFMLIWGFFPHFFFFLMGSGWI